MALALAACEPAAPGPTAGAPDFDGERAFALVERQVAFGPRVPGTPGHTAQLTWMLSYLDSVAPEVVADSFVAVTTNGDSLPLVNVIARFRPEMDRRVLLLAHWDTRPTADEDPDPARRDEPIPGANDGGSGTAVLLELASLLGRTPPPLGVDLVFTDGEDYGPGSEDMFLGAIRYAEGLGTDRQVGPRPVYGVLLDLVGDADPSFPVEGYSAQYAQLVVQKVRRAAARVGHAEYFPESVGIPLGDDHVPLIQAGLQTANVIDFTYGGPNNPYWHTHADGPENVSARTLGIVGQVMVELIYSGG